MIIDLSFTFFLYKKIKMSRQAVKITISKRVGALLTSSINKRNIEYHFQKRMNIIYKGSLGHENQDIAKEMACSPVTVRKWRKRWKTFEGVIEQTEMEIDKGTAYKTDLLHKIKEILSDMPRSGSSARISDPEKDRLVALACESPQNHGLPFTVWTHKELSAQAKKMGINISSSYYGILLKKRIATA
jgi:transposase